MGNCDDLLLLEERFEGKLHSLNLLLPKHQVDPAQCFCQAQHNAETCIFHSDPLVHTACQKPQKVFLRLTVNKTA